MIHPDLLNGYSYGQAVLDNAVPVWNVFGFEIAKVGYQGTVLPVIGAAFVLAKTEKVLRKFIPMMLDNIVTPLLAVLFTASFTFIAIGPVMRVVGDWMTNGVMWLFFELGPIGGAIYGVVYPLLVITGMHHSLVTSEMQILANIENTWRIAYFCSSSCFKRSARCRGIGSFLPVQKRRQNEGYCFSSRSIRFIGDYGTCCLRG